VERTFSGTFCTSLEMHGVSLTLLKVTNKIPTTKMAFYLMYYFVFFTENHFTSQKGGLYHKYLLHWVNFKQIDETSKTNSFDLVYKV